MVTNGNWASINTNTNTNLPFSVLAASLFYCLVEYPIFLMTAVVSILPGSMPGFGLIARKFPDPNSADLSAQILSQHLWWPPGASHSLTNSIHHPGNPVPSLERVESFSGSLQIKLVGFWKSPFFLNRDISGVRGHWAEMEYVLESSLRTQSGLTIQYSIN